LYNGKIIQMQTYATLNDAEKQVHDVRAAAAAEQRSMPTSRHVRAAMVSGVWNADFYRRTTESDQDLKPPSFYNFRAV